MKTSPAGAALRFDPWAEDYERGRWSCWFRALQEVALAYLDDERCRAVLDVGCGTGWAVRTLARRHPSGSIHGLDVSPGMIDEARRLASDLDNTTFRVGDACALPYPDRAFDAVLCTSSFHHYSDPALATAEMLRVTRAGGTVLILDSMRDQSLPVRLLDLLNRATERSHNRYPTAGEMERCLRQAGAVDVQRPFAKKAFRWEGKLITGVTLWRATAPGPEKGAVS